MLGKTQVVTTGDTLQITHLTPAQVEENMRLIDDLKFFLATAPANWQKNQIIRRYYLNHDEGFVSCVYWNNLYFITGTDIVRCIVYRFEQFGREIVDRKKFEEGIFSDLRSLKCGSDAVLEASKSPFLDFLYKNSCLRTQKKQKVFFWFSVPHDKLFADALERDLKKEQVDQSATTRAKQEPALSFQYNSSSPLHDQLLAYVGMQKKEEIVEQDLTPNNTGFTPDTIPEEAPQKDETGEDDQLQQHTFYIKEEAETGTPVITPGRLEDDFPLDYFPVSTEERGHLMVDPSVFMNPPDHFDDQFLIDQTYAKTPFYQTAFEPSVIKEEDDKVDGADYREDDATDGVVPVSQIPTSGVAYPGMPHMVPNQLVVGLGGYYYPQQPFGTQMTNGQFYDQQGEDGQYDYDDMPYYSSQNPLYYQYGEYPQHMTHVMHPMAPQPSSALFGEGDSAEGYYEYYDSQQQVMMAPQMSPFGRVFPSFQATAPPPPPSSSASSSPVTQLKHATPGKVTKPSSLRQERSFSKMRQHGDRIVRDAVRNLKKGSDKTSANDDDNDGDDDNKEPIIAGSPEKEGQYDDGEHTTLPTPESTAENHNTTSWTGST